MFLRAAYSKDILESREKSFAHDMSFSISYPATAIGKSPTGVNTEYLPPTSSGITNVL